MLHAVYVRGSRTLRVLHQCHSSNFLFSFHRAHSKHTRGIRRTKRRSPDDNDDETDRKEMRILRINDGWRISRDGGGEIPFVRPRLINCVMERSTRVNDDITFWRSFLEITCCVQNGYSTVRHKYERACLWRVWPGLGPTDLIGLPDAAANIHIQKPISNLSCSQKHPKRHNWWKFTA